MTIPTITASAEGEVIDPQRGLLSTCAYVSDAHLIKPHGHQRAQLLFTRKGSATVSINGQCWHLSPENAVWINSGDVHGIHAPGSVEYQSVFVEATRARVAGLASGVVMLGALTRELLSESTSFGCVYALNSPESRLMGVLYDQLQQLKQDSCEIIMPRSQTLLNLCRMVIDNPADVPSLVEWGRQYGASERHLARLFKRQTGISYTQWCLRIRVLHAITSIRAGESITTVAMQLGYTGSSAFTSMFRRVTGYTPTEYLRIHPA
ncbi:MAG: AraC family transcriptional regulator [Gammaproteobacteria bacterium]|nr:AraC family transcriptional regulator [Gammaproteobacteria bacterium]